MSRVESAEMCQMDTASLCTLCVLETEGNVFENFSSSFSPDIQTSSSLNSNETDLTTLKQTQFDCIEKNVTAGYDYLQYDRAILDNSEAKIKLNNNEVFHRTKMLPEKNNDSDSKTSNNPDDANNVDRIAKSCGNYLKWSGKTFENNKIHDELSSQKDEQDKILQSQEPSSVFSFSHLSQSLSFEIGILPGISQTIIDRVIKVVDNDLIEGQKSIRESYKFDKHSDEQQRVSIETTTTTQAVSNLMNNEKVESTVKPSLEPIENFQSKITNEENHLAKAFLKVPSKEPLKRDKNDDIIEIVEDVPKKKPKIITQEVLKFPVRYLPLEHKRLAIEHSKENIRSNSCPLGIEGFQREIKRLQIPKNTTKSKCHISDMNNRGPDKFTKIHEESVTHLQADRSREKMRKVEEEMNTASDSGRANTIKTGKSFLELSERTLLSKNPSPQKVLNLSILQRQVAENSKHLIKQAEEIKRLSCSIDELRDCVTCQGTEVAATSRTKREKVKDFVTRSTQTTGPHPIIIEVDDSTDEIPSVVIVQEANRESLKTENKSCPNVEFKTDSFVRNWFHPIVLKNGPDMGREADTNARQIIPGALSSAPEKVDIQTSVDKVLPKTVENQQSNSVVQYDPYYNPLRPRRWSRNRNNQSKSGARNRFKGNKSYFPPLPIVIGNKKSTNVTK